MGPGPVLMSSAPTVLVCDSAAFSRELVGETLAEAGFRVVGEAVDGVEAVELYRRYRPDLVTMEVVLPRLGGLDALRRILEIDGRARVVMCSALAQPGLVEETLGAGALDFIAKPFYPAGLLDASRRALR